MFREALAQFAISLRALLVLTVLTGVLYPMAVTGVSQVLFPRQANGSVLMEGDKAVGSEWIGQPFKDRRYFWGRPSATAPFEYNAGASTGSNLGPTNPTFLKSVEERVHALRVADPEASGPIPVDLVTASGSGLDPHISPAAAEYQVHRVAASRGIDEEALRALVASCTEGRQFGCLGEARVHVLKLNLALDAYHPNQK